MDEQFTRDGFTFLQIKSRNPERPYKVRCLETGETKDSALSYEDAAGLITGPLMYAKRKLELDSQTSSYVKDVFERHLLGRKKSECGSIVEEEIVGRTLIKGLIIQKKEKEKYEKFIEYETEHFLVRVCFEHGLFCGATAILVSSKD